MFLDEYEALKAAFPNQVEGSFEWPRRSEGWKVDKAPEIKRLCRVFQMDAVTT